VGPRKKFTPGPPSLLFRSAFNNPQKSYLALIEYDRQNNIKGTVEPVNGTGFGAFPPHVFINQQPIYSYLKFVPGNNDPCGKANGGGVVEWNPFRLDHNTVFNDGALAVEDNLWVFTWRQLLTANQRPDSTCPVFNGQASDAQFDLINTQYRAIMSFPTFDRPSNNIAIVRRSREDFDQLSIFFGADPTTMELQTGGFTHPLSTPIPAPVASWKVPRELNKATSYIMSIPHPDRTPAPTIDISFRASPGDFIATATAADIAAWLDSVVEQLANDAIEVYAGSLLPPEWNTPLDLNITRDSYYYPEVNNPVGNYSATYFISDLLGNALALANLDVLSQSIEAYLSRPDSADVLNSAQDLDNEIYAVHFTSISAVSRAPGSIPRSSCILWIDGVKQPFDDGVDAALDTETAAKNVNFKEFFENTIIFGDSVVSAQGNSATVTVTLADVAQNSLNFKDCAAATFSQTNAVLDDLLEYARDGSLPDYYLSRSSWFVGASVEVVQDDIGLGGWSSCKINLLIVPLTDRYLRYGDVQLNTDKAEDRPGSGPFVVLGGIPTKATTDGFENYVALLGSVNLWDVNVYSVAAANSQIYTLDESFLRTQVFCGDGEIDDPEECDAADPSCSSDCTCPLRTVPIRPYGCTVCGNGIRDWEAFDVRNHESTEVCEYTLDPSCKTDCTGCIDANMFVDQTSGVCTLCGNGKLDGGEACDWKIDATCARDCKSCPVLTHPTGFGGCFRCGNGVFDAGEVCDDPDRFCSSDCTGCAPGYVPDGKGSCTKCGNGVIDFGEICDTALTTCTDCRSCDENHVPSDLGCTRCGNGALDAGEVCDTAYPDCESDCSACFAGTVPAADKLGSCSLCGNGVLNKGEKCDGDANCVDCADCREPYVLVSGGHCLLCGNGLLDDGEVCDSLHSESCASACQACLPDFEPNLDPVANPTGRCFPTSCTDAPTSDNSECQCSK